MWVLEVAALVLPIAWLLVFLGDRRRAARIRVGRCESCGYDLTGNTSGVCPECGAAIVRSAPANMPGV